MSSPLTTINLVIHNGEGYIRECLDSVITQTYPHELVEINIWDNASTDDTKDVVKDFGFRISDFGFAKFFSHNSEKNLGMWPAQEELLQHSHGEYIVVLSVDVILHLDFIKNAIETMGRDSQIGALQPKIYKYDFPFIQNTKYDLPAEASAQAGILDTLGFQIFRSRRIVNIGHGEVDRGQYDQAASAESFGVPREIFTVEGAVPVFRREALESCRLKSQGDKIVDPDFFWYGDDLDLAWRMRMFGWKQVYAPNVIAWHDRKTTKVLADGWRKFVKIRKTVPMFKRRLDWRNTTLTIIKNDFASNFWRDSHRILWRQLQMWGYFLLFEPVMFLEIFKVAKLLPRMLKRRREIMRKAGVPAKEFRRWIN